MILVNRSRRTLAASSRKRAGLPVTGHDLPRIAHELGKVGRLAARRRAGIQHPLPRLHPAQRRHQHGAFVLHLEQAVAVTRQRVQATHPLHHQRLRQQARGPDQPQPLLRKALRQSLRRDAQRVDPQRDVSGAIVRRAQGLRARPAVAVQPAFHQPLRMRMRHRQMRRRLRVGVPATHTRRAAGVRFAARRSPAPRPPACPKRRANATEACTAARGGTRSIHRH